MDNHIVDITGKTHSPDDVGSGKRKKELAMDLGSLHDNLASPVPFFIHCVYERSIDKKTTKPFKLSALDCLDIAALMKDKTDLTDKELLSFVKGVIGLYNSDFTSLMLTIGYGWVEGRELVIDTFNSYYEITGADLIPNTGETLVFGSWDIPDDAITVIIPLD